MKILSLPPFRKKPQIRCHKTVREKLKINLRMNDPTKAPDLLIKKGKKMLIVEAKHLNVSGRPRTNRFKS
jgi:hypothetical protein